MITEVLQAIRDAFAPGTVEDHLEERDGRVYGWVNVTGSDEFTELDDIRRQRLFWDQLRKTLGARATAVGPIVLEPTKRG